jgi:hypothetical protein
MVRIHTIAAALALKSCDASQRIIGGEEVTPGSLVSCVWG